MSEKGHEGAFSSTKRAFRGCNPAVIPEPPDSENAGFARSGESYGVDWSPRFGAKCPKCGVYTKASYKHLPWTGNRKTRYHLCPQCAFRFKSVAEDIKLGQPPTPDQLRYLRKDGK